MRETLSIRKATIEEFATPLDWAAAEGWNPGLDDLGAFFAADPDGFLMGWIGEMPVSSISVVRYGAGFGFLGFYIVHPDYRGRGIGLATWQAGLEYLAGRTIALDGVVDQQANYARSGFEPFGRNVRFSGVPRLMQQIDAELAAKQLISPAQIHHLDDIKRIDKNCFGTERPNFISEWCLQSMGGSRNTLVISQNGLLKGYGTIRKCRSGYKIGPLFCNDPNAANALFAALIALCEAEAEVSIDVPVRNKAAMHLTETFGLRPTFETERMYFGPVLPINWDGVFGITSLELG